MKICPQHPRTGSGGGRKHPLTSTPNLPESSIVCLVSGRGGSRKVKMPSMRQLRKCHHHQNSISIIMSSSYRRRRSVIGISITNSILPPPPIKHTGRAPSRRRTGPRLEGPLKRAAQTRIGPRAPGLPGGGGGILDGGRGGGARTFHPRRPCGRRRATGCHACPARAPCAQPRRESPPCWRTCPG